MSCCGTQNLSLAFARQILTAATPFCSLYLPRAALANVPTSNLSDMMQQRASYLWSPIRCGSMSFAHWIHFAFATRRSGSLLTRRRVSESSPKARYLSTMHSATFLSFEKAFASQPLYYTTSLLILQELFWIFFIFFKLSACFAFCFSTKQQKNRTMPSALPCSFLISSSFPAWPYGQLRVWMPIPYGYPPEKCPFRSSAP